MIPKKILFAILFLGCFCFLPWSAQGKPKNFEELLEERQAHLWVEGQALGDLIIGSRGQVEFIYVDKPLIDRARKEGWGSVPDWFRKECQYFGSPELKGRDLFVVRYKSLLPWNFSPEEIRVGDYRISWKDVLTNKAFFPWGELPSEVQGVFAFGVPRISGKITEIAYGEYMVSFTVPGR
ncbi:MAG TPA: hypothetical protein PK364_06125 [Synergistaceae bacterium]|nr:hypothetical protein [Synergistaceae bacterium]HPJ24933.1 hypothetical protein [Synergistaceae bacterium]HPQ37851.1 hypothetical protein [Synergistaceae bacterium]